jgi:hypothetical protein
VTPIGETLGRLAGQFAGDLVDLERAVGEVEFRQRDRRRTEGVGFHHVRPGLEVAAMDVPDQVGAGQDQDVGAILPPPVILLHVQSKRLHAAAHAAITQQDGITQRIKQMGTAHCGMILSNDESVSRGNGRVGESGSQPETYIQRAGDGQGVTAFKAAAG